MSSLFALLVTRCFATVSQLNLACHSDPFLSCLSPPRLAPQVLPAQLAAQHTQLVTWLATLRNVDAAALRNVLTSLLRVTPQLGGLALDNTMLEALHVLAQQSVTKARMMLPLLQSACMQRCQLHLTGAATDAWALESSVILHWLALSQDQVRSGGSVADDLAMRVFRFS